MKNVFAKPSNRMDMTEERISNLEDMSTKTFSNEIQR